MQFCDTVIHRHTNTPLSIPALPALRGTDKDPLSQKVCGFAWLDGSWTPGATCLREKATDPKNILFLKSIICLMTCLCFTLPSRNQGWARTPAWTAPPGLNSNSIMRIGRKFNQKQRSVSTYYVRTQQLNFQVPPLGLQEGTYWIQGGKPTFSVTTCLQQLMAAPAIFHFFPFSR